MNSKRSFYRLGIGARYRPPRRNSAASPGELLPQLDQHPDVGGVEGVKDDEVFAKTQHIPQEGLDIVVREIQDLQTQVKSIAERLDTLIWMLRKR